MNLRNCAMVLLCVPCRRWIYLHNAGDWWYGRWEVAECNCRAGVWYLHRRQRWIRATHLLWVSNNYLSRPPLSSDIIIFTDRPELKAKGERIIFEDREVLKRKFSLGETALFNPDRILVKLSRILTENWKIPVNWPFFHDFAPKWLILDGY